jgi:hypothetical protein
MSQSNQLLNKDFVLRGEYHAVVPQTDGDLRFAEVTGVAARIAMERDELEHVIQGQRQVVDREVDKISATLTLAFREAVSPMALSLFVSQGLAQTIDTKHRMLCTRDLVNLYSTNKYYLPIPYGMLQQHTATEFPAPTGVTGADAGTGTISAGTYYAWAVPAYLDADVHRGKSLTLANLATYVRGIDYVCGTPSDASAAITAAGSKGMTVSWSGVAPAAPYPTPTHYLVVVGSTSDITAATSKICAVVAYPLLTSTFTAIGATAFGTAPALGDLFTLQTIGVTGSARTFSSLTPVTDYTLDLSAGTVVLTASGSASHSGKGFRVVNWFCASPSVVQPFGSANTTERVLPVRLYAIHGSSANINTRRPYGAMADLWEVDFANLPDELLSSPGRRYHTPKPVTLPANWNSAKGAIGQFTAFAPEFANLINFYGSDISAG